MAFIIGKTVTETFFKRASATPNLIGFKYKTGKTWREVSYREFYADVRAMSFGLMSLGVVRGDRVAILSNTRYEWTVSDMGILGAGAITVPIYPSNTAEDVAYILNHSEARVLIVEDEQQCRKIADFQSKLPRLEKIVVLNPGLNPQLNPGQNSGQQGSTPSIEVISLAALREAGKIEEGKNPSRFETYLHEAQPKDVISIVYTSGTTGTPKGALITHDNMVSVMEDVVVALSGFSESESEVILSFLPFSHIL